MCCEFSPAETQRRRGLWDVIFPQRRRGAEGMEVTFCCFSGRDKTQYETILEDKE